MTTQQNPPYSAYQEALKAENAWQAELVREFGRKAAGDARYYDKGMGKPGTPLREAHDAYIEARTRWEEETREHYRLQAARDEVRRQRAQREAMTEAADELRRAGFDLREFAL